MSAAASAIVVRNLSKSFKVAQRPVGARARLRSLVRPTHRTAWAVRDVSFAVEAGESLAFLGPNGAGKSTTIKMLTGLLTASGGVARVLGLDPQKERRRLSFVIGTVFGQKSQLWYHLPALDSLRLLGAVYEVEPREHRRRIGELTERFDLGELLDVPVRRLSLGQRIRCELAASLLHHPRLLFLDEPTIGLDVVVKQQIRALLDQWNRDHRVTLFLTSHDLGDVEKISRRALLIHHGTLILDQSIAELKRLAGLRKTVRVKYAAPVDLSGLALPLAQVGPDTATIEVDARRHRIPEIVSALAALGDVSDITIEDEPLEDLIAELYRSTTLEETHARAAR
jgi:ABC-2 type transport system ATP-binding protein